MGIAHNDLVDLIYARLAKSHTNISKNVPYALGELDVLVIEGHRAIAVEVKTTDRKKSRHKAYHQLLQASEHYYPVTKKQFYGFYCYWTDKQRTEYRIERLI